ncbi:MAG: hypothetical protein PHI47_10690 [Sulfuricurvum sp.]|uniref:hypothetical protein n=1 Tax=Sulfuricurvum sp. TaxID=2025608 RepID=UPI0026038AEF|nr:hypothetical protein [Sulfuricurvum sp.]MDD5160509.1 hypothetical protein [Sulfuricurvum sp.]
MSNIIYKFLNESFLLRSDYIDTTYSQVSDRELMNELQKYREFCIKNIQSILSDINLYKHDIKIFSAKSLIDIPRLMQTALYMDQVTLPDPIFEHGYENSQFSNTLAELNGITNDTINRISLSKSAKLLKNLAPMIEVGYVKLFPVSYFFEPQSEIPLIASTTSEVLPKNIMQLYVDNADIKSFTKDGQHITFDKTLRLRRDITIKFDPDFNESFFYQLFEQNVLSYDEATRMAQVAMSIPSHPPSKNSFEAWVSQSLYQSAFNHYTNLFKEIQLANAFKSQYTTHSSFIGKLLKRSVDKEIKSFTAECVLNFDLHFLKNIDIQTLMSIRQNDGEEFAVFRRELEKQFRVLRTEQNIDILRSKIADITHEMTEVQVAAINAKVKNLKKGVLANLALGVLGLSGSIATSGISLLATAVATVNGYKTYNDYQQKIRENPSFFLWKINNETNK